MRPASGGTPRAAARVAPCAEQDGRPWAWRSSGGEEGRRCTGDWGGRPPAYRWRGRSSAGVRWRVEVVIRSAGGREGPPPVACDAEVAGEEGAAGAAWPREAHRRRRPGRVEACGGGGRPDEARGGRQPGRRRRVAGGGPAGGGALGGGGPAGGSARERWPGRWRFEAGAREPVTRAPGGGRADARWGQVRCGRAGGWGLGAWLFFMVRDW